VPTDHWAYDAIDKLQAEGFVEGYPDGTFRGNRSFTRYEMAMVVARIWDRLVAELEALDIQQGDWATKSDLDDLRAMLEDLRAEFQAELDAMGIRLTDLENRMTAAEGRLDALEAGLDAIQITGSAPHPHRGYHHNDYQTYGGFKQSLGQRTVRWNHCRHARQQSRRDV